MCVRRGLLAGSVRVAPGSAPRPCAAAELAQRRHLPPAPAKGAADERTELARRHFKNGVKLFQDKNYQGALAEFEAAYELKPGASSLQNIALCLKALFRYAEAARKLDLLLARHGGELSDDERRAVREAIDELNQLVGSIRAARASPRTRGSRSTGAA